MKDAIKTNPISNTAYYCCGIRMDDAVKPYSLCHDHYAKRFMDEHGRAIYAPFQSEKMSNIFNVTRCRIIDDGLRNELDQNNDIQIITIGAGFDTRPYRLSGGNWIEIDEPHIIDIKNEKLPIHECTNPLKRITINFDEESLAETLAPFVQPADTIIVMEGVFVYLSQNVVETTIETLQSGFPKHVLYCDLMTRQFFVKLAQRVHKKFAAAGGVFTDRPEYPEHIFLDKQYDLIERLPMLTKASELGILWREAKIPKWLATLLIHVFLKDIAGYAVHRFGFNKHQSLG